MVIESVVFLLTSILRVEDRRGTLQLMDMPKPLPLRAGILLMQLNALLILICAASGINIASFDSFGIDDPAAARLILVVIAAVKLQLARLMSQGVNWARMMCWAFVFWPHGSGSIHEMNLFLMNHLSLILLFLSPSNRWFKMVRDAGGTSPN